MNKFCRIIISCATKSEAQAIIDQLLEDKLVACCDISPNEANYWWKGKVERETRYQISALSVSNKRDRIIQIVKKLHSDETPGIVFSEFDANEEFLDWIEESIKKD